MFNVCLKNSLHPMIWADDYISSIFKSDEPGDPCN